MTGALTVIQVLPALEAGGVERGTLEIASALVEHGHRSIVISAGGRLCENLVDNGSEHIPVPVGRKSPLTFRFASRLRSILRESGADILHVRSRFPAWVCRLALKGLKADELPGFITSVHGPYTVNRYSRVMLSGDRVIAISKFIAGYIQRNYPGLDQNRIAIIPRGVSPDAFPYGHQPTDDWLSRWYREFPQTAGCFLVTLPARITRWKGHEDFIRMMQHFDRQAGIHGLIVGGPHEGKEDYMSELRSRIRALELEDRVSFTGHRQDIREIMSISGTVLSLANKPEAFGRTTLESLALGVPALGYDHGGTSEILASIFPVGRVPVGDIDYLARRIRDFMTDRPTVPDNNPYTLARMQDSTLNLYRSLAGQRAKEGV